MKACERPAGPEPVVDPDRQPDAGNPLLSAFSDGTGVAQANDERTTPEARIQRTERNVLRLDDHRDDLPLKVRRLAEISARQELVEPADLPVGGPTALRGVLRLATGDRP